MDNRQGNKLIDDSLRLATADNDGQLQLDCSSFMTAYGGGDSDYVIIEGPASSRGVCPPDNHVVSSQRLVDSDNEESTDDGDCGDGTADCLAAKKVNPLGIVNEFANRREAAPSNNEPNSSIYDKRLDWKRASWRDQSIMNRSSSSSFMLMQQKSSVAATNDDDDDRRDDCSILDRKTMAALEQCQPATETATETESNGAKVTVQTNSANDADADDITKEEKFEKQQQQHSSILIRVEQYGSIPGSSPPPETSTTNQNQTILQHGNRKQDQDQGQDDDDDEVHGSSSIKLQNLTLDNLICLNNSLGNSPRLNRIIRARPTSDREQASSTLDLSLSATTSNQQAATIWKCKSSIELAAGAQPNEMSQMDDIEAGARSTRLIGCQSSECLSDCSNQVLESSMDRRAGNLGCKTTLERKQLELRLRRWKRSNRIITRIRENPLNMQLDYLETLGQLDVRPDEISAASEHQTSEILTTATTATITTTEHEACNRRDQEQTTGTSQQLLDANNDGQQQQQQQQQQQEHLNHCASHLSHLYRKNPAAMDTNNDFRVLMYNIICCLLVQDDQVLGTPSVGKMLEVIRAHLESASRVYQSQISGLAPPSTASKSLARTALQEADGGGEPVVKQQVVGVAGQADSRPGRKSSLVSVESGCSQTSCSNTASSVDASQQPLTRHKSERPADFRRISSVSFNDQQLISDLCQDRVAPASHRATQPRSGSLSVGCTTVATAGFSRDGGPRSPWAYQELASERWPGAWSNQEEEEQQGDVDDDDDDDDDDDGRFTSQSCSSASHLIDSGNGTMYDFQMNGPGSTQSGSSRAGTPNSSVTASGAATTTTKSMAREGRRRRRGPSPAATSSSHGQFKPKQCPSYMSTDDYNEQYCSYRSSICGGDEAEDDDQDQDDNNNNNNHQEDSAANGLHHHHQQQQQQLLLNDRKCSLKSDTSSQKSLVDVASRKAELEWTLNRLINFELKHAWLTSNDTLRRAIRKIGVPNEIRDKVWLILIEQMIGSKYEPAKLLAEANETIRRMEEEDQRAGDSGDGDGDGDDCTKPRPPPPREELDDEIQSILKQIELDVNRTMPGHKLFDDGAEGGIKLRRILVAYSVHVNRAIAYCQGFNFIVALLLSVFDGNEEKALRGFVCIVDHIFPSKYYFDHYLTGARADQFLLADFICDQLIKNPTTDERKMVEGVTSSITLNWFISLFHGAVPTLVTPPSSCDVFATIRNTARDMYDIKLLLSIVDQIKLPKDSYFAIRRSFYMVQSSFNSDQFYMQTLSNDAKRNLVSNKPLSVQQPLETKPPALSSFIGGSSSSGGHSSSFNYFTIKNSICTDSMGPLNSKQGPRIRTSADRTKVCIQSLGKLGRSHLKIIDVNTRTNERALMSPLRNCLVLGLTNDGKNLIIARQSSRRSYKTLREQDLQFHIFDFCTEIFDGFYLEESNLALVLTHKGEVFKVDTRKCLTQVNCHDYGDIETLMLRDNHTFSEHEKVKLRLASLDSLTNLLWVYVECEDTNVVATDSSLQHDDGRLSALLSRQTVATDSEQRSAMRMSVGPKPLKFKNNNPFLSCDTDSESNSHKSHHQYSMLNQKQATCSYYRKILMIDIITFDLFSAFTIEPSFGEILDLKTSLVAFCQLANPMSSQFSSKILQIGPTGRYEQLLSLSDVVDYMVNVPETFKSKFNRESRQESNHREKKLSSLQRYSSLRRLLTHSKSLSGFETEGETRQSNEQYKSGTLSRYCKSLIKSHSVINEDSLEAEAEAEAHEALKREDDSQRKQTVSNNNKRTNKSPNEHEDSTPMISDNTLRSVITLGLGDFSGLSETNYVPVNMAFIFKNGKIALFEFTESYTIHTRESQLERYDYSRIIDVQKSGESFIVTILTVFDKLIKVVI